MHETYFLIGLVIVFAILFALGLKANSGAIVKYAEQIRAASSSYCKFVGFRRYSRGFKALCVPKEERPLSRIDVTVSLTWRENPMYYLLFPFTKDRDKIFVWGTLVKKSSFNIEIFKIGYKYRDFNKSLEQINLSGLEMVAVTNDLGKLKDVLSKIEAYLFASKNCIKFVSIKEGGNWIKLVGDLTDNESINSMFNLLIESAHVLEDLS
ncbi:MAG: hypothetical protein QXW80_05435 [Candidatus Micrarchaeia archaeon]